MTETVKFTQVEMYDAIASVFAGGELPEGLTAQMVVDFCATRKASVQHRAEKAKEYAAKKKAEGDMLTDAVFAALSGEPASIDDITARVDGEDVTRGKVAYRLNALVKDGKAVKSEIAIPATEDKKATRVAAYALA